MLLVLGGCSGELAWPEGPSARGFADSNDPSREPERENSCNQAVNAFAPARLWQLTDEQYVHVVRDVFGVTLTGSDAAIVSAAEPERYTNYSEGVTIGLQVAPSYQVAAQKVAAQVVAARESLLGSASPSTQQVRQFVMTKVARAFRRPVAEAELHALLSMYEEALPDANVGLSLIMQAVLQAPSFLYRTEIGQGAQGGATEVDLTPYEIASALSFTLLESVPDDALWQKAEDGSLRKPDVLAAEVDRLLTLPEVRAVLMKKVSYWLGLEGLPRKIKDQTLFPEFTPSLRESLYRSMQAFLGDTLWEGTLFDLFMSSKVYANSELAEAYDLGSVAGDELVAVEVPERAAGILTQPGFLAAANKWNDRGDPIHRGLHVYEAFICGAALPPPPADAFAVGAALEGTEREKVALRADMPRCRACHAMFDPVGLAFEQYDAIGRFSALRYTELDPSTGITSWKEATEPVDSSAVLSEALGPELAGPIAGVEDLAARLSGAEERVARCAARRLAEYALGYNPDAQNSCQLDAVKQAFAESGSFAEFFRALFTSHAFVTRAIGD